MVLAEGKKPRPFGAVDPPTLARIEADEVDNETTILDATVNAFSRSSKTGIAFSKQLGRGFRFEYTGPEKLEKEDVFSWSQFRQQPIRMTGRFVRFFDNSAEPADAE